MTRRTGIRAASFLSAMLCLLSSCEKSHFPKGSIRPVVKGVETKSGTVLISDNEPYDQKAGTNSEKLSVNGFVVDAWLENEAFDNATGKTVPVHYIDTKDVTFDSQWTISGDPKWVNGICTRFWCWNRMAAASGLDTSLDYVETSDSRDFSFKVPSNASDRRDIVMAFSRKTWNSSSDDDIEFRFGHPLVNICFTASSTFSENLDIAEVKLKNVYTQGSFSYSGNGAGSSAFTWSNQSGKGDIIEKEDVSKADIRKLNFFVPEQTLSSDTRLCVTFRRKDDTTVTREVAIAGATPSWSANHFYCYQIGATDALNQPIVFTVELVAWSEYTETDGDLTLNY